MKASVKKIMSKLNAELVNVAARMIEIDKIYESGSLGSDELNSEYESLVSKEKSLNEAIKNANLPSGICKNTEMLVSLNID